MGGMESKFVPTLSNLKDAYINDIEDLQEPRYQNVCANF